MSTELETCNAVAAATAFAKSGMYAIVGRANVGKSSLMNALLSDKVSIVSSVAQTTRNRIRGIYTDSRGQLVFLDTPGVFKAPHDLGRIMNKAARSSVEGVDGVVLVLDPSCPLRDEDVGWMRKLSRSDAGVHIVLNKQDLPWAYESACRQAWDEACATVEVPAVASWYCVSALRGEGITALVADLFAAAPEGPAMFPEDVLTDFPRQLAIADVIREKYFHVLRDEVPHDLAVRITALDEAGTDWTIHADILVNRASQKGIVIGDKGRLLRRVKRSATREIAEMYGVDVSLHLWVKIEKNWSRNFWILRQLGYE
ncbi:MAG: GTPase Era [Kiritimatiellia bacterium]